MQTGFRSLISSIKTAINQKRLLNKNVGPILNDRQKRTLTIYHETEVGGLKMIMDIKESEMVHAVMKYFRFTMLLSINS